MISPLTVAGSLIMVSAIMNEDRLLRAIERHLRLTGETPSAFGLRAVKDSHIVFDLREGREVRRNMLQRIMSAIAETQRAA